MTTTTHTRRGGYRTVSLTLFLCLFAAQSAMIAMSPVLVAPRATSTCRRLPRASSGP